MSVLGAKNSTQANANGNFILQGVRKGATLVFDYIGCNEKRVVVDENDQLAVSKYVAIFYTGSERSCSTCLWLTA